MKPQLRKQEERFMISLLLALFISQAQADVRVHNYINNNGTYVQSYERASPDHSIYNNNSYHAPRVDLNDHQPRPFNINDYSVHYGE